MWKFSAFFSPEIRIRVWACLQRQLANGTWLMEEYHLKELWDIFLAETNYAVIAGIVRFYNTLQPKLPTEPWTVWNFWTRICLLVDKLEDGDLRGGIASCLRIFILETLKSQQLMTNASVQDMFGVERVKKIAGLLEENDMAGKIQVFRLIYQFSSAISEDLQSLLASLVPVTTYEGEELSYACLCMVESLARLNKRWILSFQQLICSSLESDDYTLRLKV